MSSRHSIWIAATPDRVYQAVRTTDLGGSWIVRLLMGLRGLPARIARTLRRPAATASVAETCRSVQGVSFTLIEEEPGRELVLGVMGRFWTPSGEVLSAGPEQFRAPPPPGLAQAVWNLRVEPEGTGTRLSTETRVRCADPVTRRSFARYWRIIRFGSGLTRRSMLSLIRRTAERGAT